MLHDSRTLTRGEIRTTEESLETTAAHSLGQTGAFPARVTRRLLLMQTRDQVTADLAELQVPGVLSRFCPQRSAVNAASANHEGRVSSINACSILKQSLVLEYVVIVKYPLNRINVI